MNKLFNFFSFLRQSHHSIHIHTSESLPISKFAVSNGYVNKLSAHAPAARGVISTAATTIYQYTGIEVGPRYATTPAPESVILSLSARALIGKDSVVYIRVAAVVHRYPRRPAI